MGLFKELKFSKKEKIFLEVPGDYKGKTIYGPVEGKIIALSEVSDEVFATKVLGDGIAVYPSAGKLYSPVNGKISALFPTNHAIGITSDDGMEILLHIGIDTVSMNGDGFKAFIEKDIAVKAGQLLIEFDIAKIENKGLNPSVMIIVTNYQEIGTVIIEQYEYIKCMEKLLSISN